MVKGEHEKNASSLPAAVLAGWAIILLIAFIWNRGSDIGQIGSLTRNLGGGPLLGLGFFDSLNGFCAATLIVVALAGLGKTLRRCIYGVGKLQKVFTLAIDAAVGAAVWSLVWFFLGLAGAYSSGAAIITTVAGIAMFLMPLRTASEEKKPRTPLAGFDGVILLLLGVTVLVALIASLAPPIAKDTLLYHFALPKAFIAQHGNSVVEGNIASYLPLGAEMHYVWAMLIGGVYSTRAAEAAAGGISFWFYVLLVMAVYGWARYIELSRTWALIAALMTASIPTAYHVAAAGYIDNALALYVTLAVYGLSRWWTSGRNWLFLIAICLSATLSIKLTSLFVFAGAALIILIRAQGAKEDAAHLKRIMVGGFGALILAALLASPWYIRTWEQTGSPVFPFYMSILKGNAPGWDVERSDLFQAMNSSYGGEHKSFVDYLALPWNISVTGQPEKPEYFDGVIGVSFLIGLPFLIWALWKFETPIDVKIGVGIAAVVFLLWLSSSQQIRYLLPVLPVLAVCIAASLSILAMGAKGVASTAQMSLTASGIVGILTIFAWFCQAAPLRVVLGGETRDAYLSRDLDYYAYYKKLDVDAPADAKVWLINMRRDTYYLDRPVVSDYLFEDWTLKQMVWNSRTSEELRAKAAATGVQYILARHDFLLDPAMSDIVDENRSKAENDAKLKMVRDLLLDPSRTVRSDSKFSLVKLY